MVWELSTALSAFLPQPRPPELPINRIPRHSELFGRMHHVAVTTLVGFDDQFPLALLQIRLFRIYRSGRWCA